MPAVVLQLRSGGPNISLSVRPSELQRGRRMHLDLYSNDQPRDVDRLLALGATWPPEPNRSPEALRETASVSSIRVDEGDQPHFFSAGCLSANALFAQRLSVETDADDVATPIAAGQRDFHLVDARSPDADAAAHLPGAIILAHRLICEEAIADLSAGLLVVCCWGPGCNAATNAAARLTAVGRPVKELIGGFE